MFEHKLNYSLSFSDVIDILKLFDETNFAELTLEVDSLKLHVVQEPARVVEQPLAARNLVTDERRRRDLISSGASELTVVSEIQGDETPVLAPLAGTFYRAASPGGPSFVEVGNWVREGDVIGILEIMKLMNNVSAPCSGVVRRICARNEEFVESGQLLAVIAPKPDV